MRAAAKPLLTEKTTKKDKGLSTKYNVATETGSSRKLEGRWREGDGERAKAEPLLTEKIEGFAKG